ncbi:chemotaxis protein CheD [Halopelagius longus]|uniref:Probable chemoreceptor glutamine deamidase CheD n=1 Tax=Halopelagius longus TaxID=1236180 RepID=A0A1H1BFR4_9EURY|nr:chemotaxis protein CheD [Halopelagius longus]RDI70769.1 chemotaxis protein CheD [Halopelagius longus]SDQ50731.1 chemotaxis protein CheD [Halopelagius longus]
MKVYTSETQSTHRTKERIKVGIADFAVGTGETTLVTSGLGSCVGIAVFDAQQSVGGLAHAMLPTADGDENDAKYVDTAVPALVGAMEKEGAVPGNLRAKLAGGATMFEFTSAEESIGDRNVVAARDTLDSLDIPLVAEDVGGDYGRSLQFSVRSADLRVRSANAGVSTL